MIRRLSGLVRRVSFRQLVSNPRAELGRILAWVGRRLERVGMVVSHGRPDMPAWLQAEMIALASIEPELLGAEGDTAHYRHYGIPVVTRPGELYRQLVAEVGTERPSHVMIVPWLVRGGADRGALYHLQAWVEAMPASSVLLILTEPVDSPWMDRIPAGVRVLRFGQIVGSMALEGRVQLLTRLLVQMQPAVIHNINSRVAWQSFSMYGLALKQRSRLFASLFCDDHDERGVPVGYARSFLRRCYPNLSGVFCDNTVFPKTWSVELGVPLALFTVLRFPYDREVVVKAGPFEISGPPRVLWAGRFDRQKRPDILLAIAEAMPGVAFDVYGVTDLGSRHQAIDALKALPNVSLHGPFARFEEIVTPAHAAYLFTTSWEGLPTILLDACAAGVPIVAPAVGGVVDLIERSWLVDSPEDISAFVERLQRLIAEPALRQSRRQQQYAALSSVGGWETFTDAVNDVRAYLYESPGALVRFSQQGSTT